MVSETVLRRSGRVAQKRRLQISSAAESSASEAESEGSVAGENSAHENSDTDEEDLEENLAPENEKPRKRQKKGLVAPTDGPDGEIHAENPLFRALSSKEVAVFDMALEWIDNFAEDEQSNTHKAITGLFNLVLGGCGCTHMVQDHDMTSEDSASATVAEIGIIFGRQPSHEYPFNSTNASIRHFRQNVLEFFRHLVILGHEKGSLYKEGGAEESSSLGSPMMNCVLAWLSALSACNVRPLRYISSVALLEMQTQLCELASSVTISLQKQQRQLNTARNNTTSRNQRVQKSKIALIQESVDTFTVQKETVLEYIGDIFQSVFVNRYRDIDPSIRGECLKALAQWMIKYEELFLKADYLRYLGWLLSDPADSVKHEAVRSLFKLYKFINGKREAMSVGFRQFSERFKDQFISMVWKEKLPGIRNVLLDILTELFYLGFLETSDVRDICSFGFQLAEQESPSKGDLRTKIQVCKFISTVALERSRSAIEPFNTFLESHQSYSFDPTENSLSVSQAFDFKSLAELVESSLDHYQSIRRVPTTLSNSPKPPMMLVDSLFRSIYPLAGFQGQWEGLIKYLLCDFSSIKFTQKRRSAVGFDDNTATELASKLEISSSSEKQIFVSFISAAIIHILTKEAPKKAASVVPADDLNSALPILLKYVSDLEQYSRFGVDLYAIFLGIWNSILITIPTSITRLYGSVTSIADYNSVHEKILQNYFDTTSPDQELQDAYDTYFSIMLKNYEGASSGEFGSTSDRLINANIKMQFEELFHSLVNEGVEALLSEDGLVDTNDGEENNKLSKEHKIAIHRLLMVRPALQKLSQIAKFANISKYVAEPTVETSFVLLEVLHTGLISKFDLKKIICDWPTNYSMISSQISESWIHLLEFILMSLSWKLEDLTYASNDNGAQSIDISLFLDEYNGLLTGVGELCVSIGNAAKEVNETTSDSNKRMGSLVQNLIALEHSFACYHIDMLVSLRTFYDKFQDGTIYKNFEKFFNGETGVGPLVKQKLPAAIQDSFKRVFFIHEARLASLRHKSLIRQRDEAVNYEDFIFENDCLGELGKKWPVREDADLSASDASEESQEDRKKNLNLWAAERILCVYTLKLFSLARSGGLSDDTIERLQLNAKKLGVVFDEVVKAGNAQSTIINDSDQIQTTSFDGENAD